MVQERAFRKQQHVYIEPNVQQMPQRMRRRDQVESARNPAFRQTGQIEERGEKHPARPAAQMDPIVAWHFIVVVRDDRDRQAEKVRQRRQQGQRRAPRPILFALVLRQQRHGRRGTDDSASEREQYLTRLWRHRAELQDQQIRPYAQRGEKTAQVVQLAKCLRRLS